MFFGFLVLLLITPYPSIMKIARIAKPKGYSGIGAGGAGMSGTATITQFTESGVTNQDMVTDEPEAG
jgi:hypothetical protein